ncbi:MAG: spondin domain-containing protein [Chloroflexota bacterium]|nr:spondin domain-containing protein [Chloroflexota bacterium]
MLICTNNGFTGVDTLRLPQQVGETVTVQTDAYDAGTEINTEDFADIVPPCQALVGVSSGDSGTGMSNPALAEGGVIHHHEGIEGDDDLVPAIHGWTNPVAEITITRVN